MKSLKKVLSSLFLLLLVLAPIFAARPKIALVLSGGGSRGIVHVPIIKELERRGIYPDLVVGTSMGALIGGLYAIGYTPEMMEDICLHGNLNGLVMHVFGDTPSDSVKESFTPIVDNVFSLQFDKNGLGSANGMLDDMYVNSYIRTCIAKELAPIDFDELPIPFRSVGMDLGNGDKIVFDSGSLYEAMRGSMSFPIVFPPLILPDGRYVIDGGTVDNLPIDVAKEWGADIILAVDVNEDVLAYGGQPEALETLTGAALQYSVVCTQFIATANQKDATHVFIPKTRNTGIFNFNAAQTFLDIGTQCAEDNKEFLDELEKELEGYLPMKPPVRYNELPTPRIVSISLPDELGDYEEDFEKWTGAELTRENLAGFETFLDRVRSHERLKSIYYRVTELDKGQYSLDIEYAPFNTLASSVSLGLQDGAVAYLSANDDSLNRVAFTAGVSGRFNITVGPVRFRIGLDYSQYLRLVAGLEVPMNSFSDLFVDQSVLFGSFSSVGWRGGYNPFSSYNLMGISRMGFDFVPKTSTRIDLFGRVSYGSLGKDKNHDGTSSRIWEDDYVCEPVGVVSVHFTNLLSNTVYSTGIDASFEFQLGFYEDWLYSVKGELSWFVGTGMDQLLYYTKLFAATQRLRYELESSYSLGYFGTLSRDTLSGELGFRYLFDPTDRSFFMDTGLFAEYIEAPFDYTPQKAGDLVPFSLLSEWNLGLSLCGGIQTGFGQFSIFAYFGFRGDFAFGLRIR